MNQLASRTRNRFPVGLCFVAAFLAAGCAKTAPNRAFSLTYLDVVHSERPVGEVQSYQVETAIAKTGRSLTSARIAITRIRNIFEPRSTQYYYGESCDMFYLDQYSSPKCGEVEFLDVDYATRYRVESGWALKPYHLIITEQLVSTELVGGSRLIGLTTPRVETDAINQQCSIIFSGQITAWLNREKFAGACNYNDGNRSQYVDYLVNYIVGHELGRQLGKLHSPIEQSAEHNHNQEGYDYMRTLENECDPIVGSLIANGFCSSDDGIQTNSCMDRWKSRFPPPPSTP